MFTSIVPVILIAMGSADSIHLLRRIQEDRCNDAGQALKVSDALKDVVMPMAMTTVTTMIGAVPIGRTALMNVAVLGYAGIGLDSFTALIARVVIGLGIDYTIHFLARFRRIRGLLPRTVSATGGLLMPVLRLILPAVNRYRTALPSPLSVTSRLSQPPPSRRT